MHYRYWLLAIFCLTVFASCKHSLPASTVKSISGYVDGVAIAETNLGKFYFVDPDMVPLNRDLPLDSIFEWVDGYAVAFSAIQKGNCCVRSYHIFNRKGEPVVTQEYPEKPILLSGGRAWTDTKDGVQLQELATGKILLDETAWVKNCTPSGTCLLARLNHRRHPDGKEHASLVEFMIVDADGRVIVPWGRIGFIGDFYNGLAAASNSIQGGWRGHIQNLERYSRSHIHAGKYGYIDESGRWVIPEKFYWAEGFNKDGYAKVLTTNNYDYWRSKPNFIDRTGRILSGAEADKARRSLSASNEEKKSIF